MRISTLLTFTFVSVLGISFVLGEVVQAASVSNETTATNAISSQNDLEISDDEPIGANSSLPDKADSAVEIDPPKQSGPFIDLFGPTLLSLDMIDQSHAQFVTHFTNEVLQGKKVIGLYFSADWCGPCRQFTPDLVSFYNKMNARRGKQDEFEIVWISRCRDFNSFGQYFTHMNWLAMQPEAAMGQQGQKLSEKYKVKGIPTLVLLDEIGNVITTDARNKIPQDKAGIGFPWRNPLATVYMTILPKSLRHMLKTQVASVKDVVMSKIKGVIGSKLSPVA